MSETNSRPSVLPWLVLLAVLSLGAAIWFGQGESSGTVASLADAAPAVQERMVAFVEEDDGTLVVIDALTDAQIRRIPSQQEAFMRAMVKAVERDRYAHGADAGTAMRLSSRADGDLLLIDDSTGVLYHLRAFGPTNLGAFATLLAVPPSSDPVALSGASEAAGEL